MEVLHSETVRRNLQLFADSGIAGLGSIVFGQFGHCEGRRVGYGNWLVFGLLKQRRYFELLSDAFRKQIDDAEDVPGVRLDLNVAVKRIAPGRIPAHVRRAGRRHPLP